MKSRRANRLSPCQQFPRRRSTGVRRPRSASGRSLTLAAIAIGLAVLPVWACGGTSSGGDAGAGVDPVLLDYVAPVDGDAWQAARVRFDVGITQVQARKK